MGLTKITFFLFVFLLLFIPKDNFKGNAYYYSFMFVGILGLIGYLWTSNYAGVAFHQSYRHEFWVNEGINSTNQLNYLLSHKKDAVIEIFRIPQYLETDLLFNSRDLYFNSFSVKDNFYTFFCSLIDRITAQCGLLTVKFNVVCPRLLAIGIGHLGAHKSVRAVLDVFCFNDPFTSDNSSA